MTRQRTSDGGRARRGNESKARPGDAFHVWDFADLCRDNNTLADGKYPDAEGRVPSRGAY